MNSWHALPHDLEVYRSGAAAPVLAYSIEAHLFGCAECREALARVADPAAAAASARRWAAISASLDAGAVIVNDTSGEESDRSMDGLVADTGAAMIVMHSRGTPETMRSLIDYDDVVVEVRAFLMERASQLEAAGVAGDAIALDPGFGFAKTPEQNLVLLRRLRELTESAYPILAGTSRKSFIGRVLDVDEAERLEGTAATVTWAVACGARIVRVHDVREMTRVVRMTEAILETDLGASQSG